MPKDSITSKRKGGGLVPLKITVAPNGARRTHKDHPMLPTKIADIAQTAKQCCAAGAHELHLHVRDGNQQHTLDTGVYREAMFAVADAAPNMQIQITTEAAGLYDVAEQFDVLRQLVPAAASISIREMARDDRLARRMYDFAEEAGIHVQHILYDLQDIDQYRSWLAKSVISPTQRDVLLVLGQYSPPRQGYAVELPGMVAALNGEMTSWSVCAFGLSEQKVAQAAICMSGHVRVGFENNLQREDGQLLTNNVESVELVIQSASNLGRPLLGKVQTP